ncbi:MAG: TRAP transporter small permease [Spirochaetes bacterium]|nr:TRAP transporter small permease [Spirochaetota bacterium]
METKQLGKMNVLHHISLVDRMVGKILRGISVMALTLLFFLLLGNVFFRFVPIFSFGWFDEIVEMVFAYFVFFGSAALWREREHFRVCLVPDTVKGNWKRVIDIFIEGCGVLFFLILLLYSTELTIRATDQTPIFKMSKRVLYACVPVSSFIMLIYATVSFVLRFRGKPSNREGCLEESV